MTTSRSSISSNQRPRDFMARSLRSLWGAEPQARPLAPQTAQSSQPTPAPGSALAESGRGRRDAKP